MRTKVDFPRRDLQWWKERLDIATFKNDSDFMAFCPSHEDAKASLHVTLKESGKVDVYCHAFCLYKDIIEAIDGRPIEVSTTLANGNGQVVDTSAFAPNFDPLDEWAKYTGVPREEWEALGCKNEALKVSFRFIRPDGSPAPFRKLREVHGQKGLWVGESKPSGPILWPAPNGETSRTVWLMEGESDTGVMRHAGFPAYTFGGVGNAEGEDAADVLREWEFTKAIICFDADKAGRTRAAELLEEFDDAGFDAEILPLGTLVDRRYQEKDIRDLYKRVGDDLHDLILERQTRRPSLAINAVEYEERAPENVPWLCEPYLAVGSLTLLFGIAKGGKTTWTFALLREMRDPKPGLSGGARDFLGSSVTPTNCLYLTEDAPTPWKVKRQVHMLPGEQTHIDTLYKGDIFSKAPTWLERIKVIENELKIRPNIRFVIVDTITVWADIEDENNATAVNRALEHLRLLAVRYNVAILAIHYFNRQGNFRGSGAFIAVPDIIVDIERVSEQNQTRRLKLKSKLSAIEPEPLLFDMVDPSAIPIRLKVVEGSDGYNKILDVFNDKEELSLIEVCRRLRIVSGTKEYQAVRTQLGRMVADGILLLSDAKKYRVHFNPVLVHVDKEDQ